MALDACFMLECLQFFVKQPDEMRNQLLKVFDPFGRSATHNAIMRDVMMLENQVPLFLLQKLLEIQLGSQAMAEESLFNLVRLDFTDLSPFLFSVPDSSSLRIKERSHILEALYFSLFLSAGKDDLHAKGDEDDEQPPSPGKTSVPQEFSCEWRALLWWKVGPIWKCASGLTQWVMKHPIHFLSLLGNLPGPRPLKGFFNFLSAIDKAEEKKEEEKGSSVEISPTRDELDIPCVADLYYAGVRFLPSEGDLTTIRFEQATATLHLPKVRLDSNTEVILRNLVAFEASAAPGDLIFIRYVDFMNGIIDTDEDVRLLIKSGIIYNHLESDGKVASLWNSMGKCVKLSKVKYLDKVITDVNSYYKRTWSVSMVERMKKYIFRSWRCLSLVAALILLLLTALQAFCSVFKCKPW